MRPDEVYEVEVDVVVAATAKALLCSIDNEEVWLPRSQIVEGDLEGVGDRGSVLIKAWLAREKGWL